MESDSACERAVEAFLGDRLQAVLVPDASHAVHGVRWLQESGAGRGTFLPLANARDAGDGGPLREIARQEPKVRGLLSDLYRVTGPHADRIRASLPDALVVETLEDALEIVARHGPVACATLAGETLRGAMVEGGRSVKGLLAPRREIREASVRREEVESRLLVARAGARGGPMLAVPLYDDTPARRTPTVTYGIIGLCLLVFLWQQSLPPGEERAGIVRPIPRRTKSARHAVEKPAVVRAIPFFILTKLTVKIIRFQEWQE